MKLSENVKEIIDRYGLETDEEYIIIPFTDSGGKRKRCFILKRNYIRVVSKDGFYKDYPLDVILKATLRYPDKPLSESVRLIEIEDNILTRDSVSDE